MYSSSDHVIHAGQRCTISSPSSRGMSVDYKSIFTLAISHTFLDKWAKKSENHKIWANFDPPCNFLRGGGSRQNFETVLGTSFQGLFPEKFWTMPPDPKGLGKNFAPKFFLGGGPPQGVHKLYLSSTLRLVFI